MGGRFLYFSRSGTNWIHLVMYDLCLIDAVASSQFLFLYIAGDEDSIKDIYFIPTRKQNTSVMKRIASKEYETVR